jgi:hypothetical protein
MVQFYLWGQDALRGDFVARGFTRQGSEGNGSSLYQKDGWGLHSSGLWKQDSSGCLIFTRRSEAFWRVGQWQFPLHPTNAEAVPLAVGLERVRDFVAEHEAWIAARYGPKDRPKYCKKLPPVSRRHLSAWEEWMGQVELVK